MDKLFILTGPVFGPSSKAKSTKMATKIICTLSRDILPLTRIFISVYLELEDELLENLYKGVTYSNCKFMCCKLRSGLLRARASSFGFRTPAPGSGLRIHLFPEAPELELEMEI